MSHWEASGKSNEWYTPRYIFDALEVDFEMDVAAPEDRTFVSTPARHFITKDSLNMQWNGFVWMNPPFGGRNGILPWLEKIKRHNYGIALTPDRTSAPWYQYALRNSTSHLSINHKVKFLDPNGKPGKSPSNGTTLFAFGLHSIDVLMKAEKNNLGIVFKRP